MQHCNLHKQLKLLNHPTQFRLTLFIPPLQILRSFITMGHWFVNYTDTQSLMVDLLNY